TLLAALNSGAWLVNYLGHGSVEVWRGEVFTSLDAGTLTNGMRLPFVSTMTCLNGFFHDVWTESLAEALQRAPQGGAVAVWASSSLSEAAEQVDMNRALLKGLSAGLTLGEAVTKAKTVARDPDVRRTWILFGDPTSRLR
ncbi:MAG: C25 family cysteine peptidase, partial [Nitrospiraceae bacterium]